MSDGLGPISNLNYAHGAAAPDNAGDYADTKADELRKAGFGGRPGGKPPRRVKHPGLVFLVVIVLGFVGFYALCAPAAGNEWSAPAGTPTPSITE